MSRLAAVIAEAIVLEYGRDELLRRLSHPFWFQSFGAVMGMDWHSSGVTTSVVGALKRGLAPLAGELGVHVCGGRGRHSRDTPAELLRIGERTGIDGAALGATSRLVAKVDSAAVQDGFDLYLHAFIVTREGRWVVVQQGMNAASGQARRYHWLSEGLRSFLDDPHAAVDGAGQGRIVNLADARAARSREAQVALLHDLTPNRIAREFAALPAEAASGPATTRRGAAPGATQLELLPRLQLPGHHDVRASDLVLRRLHANLAAAAERGPTDFPELLQLPGIGARTVRALALVAEVLHGAPCRFTDPARFSLAHGGKDRHPFPVPTRVYDHTIGVLKQAVAQAKLGRADRLAALARLDAQARALEGRIGGPSLVALLAAERRDSHAFGGRSIFGWEPAPTPDAGMAKRSRR